MQINSDSEGDNTNDNCKTQHSEGNASNDEMLGGVVRKVPVMNKREKSFGFHRINGKHVVTHGGMKSIPKEVRSLVCNDMAMDLQFIQWEKDVRDEYIIKTDDEWSTTLMAWVLYCAHNGTSNKLRHTDVMLLPNGLGSTNEVQIGGFIKASQNIG